MGLRIDPATARQFAMALRPGAVLHLLQPLTGKHKFHVLIAATEQRSIAFLINSRPSPFIQNRPELLHRQVPLLIAAHPFMKHDSVIACHDSLKLPARDELIAGLCDRSINQVGHVHQSLFALMASATVGSPLISVRDAELIATAFGTPLKMP